MNAIEARIWVLESVRDSLNKFATRLKPRDISPTATPGDVKRAAHQMRKLAEFMGRKRVTACIAREFAKQRKENDERRAGHAPTQQV